MPKGWVYVDDDMEKIRVKEARDDIEIARLQREGILPAKFELAEATHVPRVLKNEKKAMRSSRGPKTEINGHGSEPIPKVLRKNSRRSDYGHASAFSYPTSARPYIASASASLPWLR
jgi:histone-lysine N-methyltransferase ASH1L